MADKLIIRKDKVENHSNLVGSLPIHEWFNGTDNKTLALTADRKLLFSDGSRIGTFEYAGGTTGFIVSANVSGGSPYVFRVRNAANADVFTVQENGVLGVFSDLNLPLGKKIGFGIYVNIKATTNSEMQMQ